MALITRPFVDVLAIQNTQNNDKKINLLINPHHSRALRWLLVLDNAAHFDGKNRICD